MIACHYSYLFALNNINMQRALMAEMQWNSSQNQEL